MIRLPLLGFVLFGLLSFTSTAQAQGQYSYTSVDYPGAASTTVWGVSTTGKLVGGYQAGSQRQAFSVRGGVFTAVTDPALAGSSFVELTKSNTRGDLVGMSIDSASFVHSFRIDKGGNFRALDFPGASDTAAFGLNSSGVVVGYWDLVDASGGFLIAHGFRWKNGAFEQIDVPGAADTYVLGVNDRGDMVGLYTSDSGSHAFLLTARGRLYSFDAPVAGTIFTEANDINASGQIVGDYVLSDGSQHSFVLSGSHFTTIDYPGAAFTTTWGINEQGEVAGFYQSDTLHGFTAAPSQ
jgi:hypothetical protein